MNANALGGTYRDHAWQIKKSGLGTPLPIPPGCKSPPPHGWTGQDAPYASGPDIQAWCEDRADWGVAIRMALNVIGIDVDAYNGTLAVDTLTRFQKERGTLAPTWVSSSRPAPSGIYWYRLPDGYSSDDLGDMGDGVQLIRAGHRYAVVAGSVHPEGRPYEWRDPAGQRWTIPPEVDSLAVLTVRQVEGLRRKQRTPAQLRQANGDLSYADLPADLQQRMDHYRANLLDGLRREAAVIAELPEGEWIDRVGNITLPQKAGWEGWLGQHLVPHAIRLEQSGVYGGTSGQFLNAVYTASAHPVWRHLVTLKTATKAAWAASLGPMEPLWLRAALEADPTDPFGERPLLPERAASTLDVAPLADPHLSPEELAALAFEREVAVEMHRMRVRQQAKDNLRREAELKALVFEAGHMRSILAMPPEPAMRAEGLVPWGATTMLVAARKSGKTTMLLNWARSLLTGEPFLGRFPVIPIKGNIAFMNYEVSAQTLARWAAEVGLDQDRTFFVNLRGKRNALGHPEDRAQLACLLRDIGTESLIVDPFARAFTGANQNDNSEVQVFLSDLDAFARSEVGATDLMLAVHAGWNGEHARGASTLEGNGDSIITIVRDEKDEYLRYLRASGRDVDVSESLLEFDPMTRWLTLSESGSRRTTRQDGKLDRLAVLAVRAAYLHPGISSKAMLEAIRDMEDAPSFRAADLPAACRLAIERGFLRVEGGEPGKSKSYFAEDSGGAE